MKTSFYFVFWILIYPLIDMLNIPFLNENSFFIACIFIMFILPKIVNRIFKKDLVYLQQKANIDSLEDIYSNNLTKIRKNIFTNILLTGVSFIYFVSFIIGINILSFSDSILLYIVFGFLSIVYGNGLIKQLKLYWELKDIEYIDNDSIYLLIDDNNIPYYENYYETRQYNSYNDICSQLGNPRKAFKITSIIFSIISIILGITLLIIWLPVLLYANTGESFIIAMILYASMAFFYGVKDIIETIRESK